MDEEIGGPRSHVGPPICKWQNSELEHEICFSFYPTVFPNHVTTLKSSTTTLSKKSPLPNFLNILKVQALVADGLDLEITQHPWASGQGSSDQALATM